MKQFNAKKTHKWGYKVFVLSCASGFSFHFNVFAEAQYNTAPVGCPDVQSLSVLQDGS